jgi:hypothetical protein
MMIALAIGVGWVLAAAAVCTFNWAASERRTPTPRPNHDDLADYRQRRCPRRPTSIS